MKHPVSMCVQCTHTPKRHVNCYSANQTSRNGVKIQENNEKRILPRILLFSCWNSFIWANRKGETKLCYLSIGRNKFVHQETKIFLMKFLLKFLFRCFTIFLISSQIKWALLCLSNKFLSFCVCNYYCYIFVKDVLLIIVRDFNKIYNYLLGILTTADFIKKVLTVYSHSMTTIYRSLSAQVAKSTFFMKSRVP